MSDEHPGNEDNPRTSIRPPLQPGHPSENPQPTAQFPPPDQQQPPHQYGQPQQGRPAPGQPQQVAPPGQGPQGQGQQGQGQQGQGQQGFPGNQVAPPYAGQPYAGPNGPGPQQSGPPQSGPQQSSPPRQEPDRGGGRSGRGIGIGLLVGALVLGLAGGFGGAWLEGDGGGGDKVDANQINTSGLDLQDLVSVQTVADKSLPSVVKIEGARSEGSGSGSGVVISEDGLILTNYHVAWLGEDGGEMEILFNDGTTAEAEIKGTDPSMDIAVLQAEDVSGLTPMPFGQAEDVKVGQAVVALGSPYGLESTVTAGIISSTNRPVDVPDMDDSGSPMVYPGLQTDAAINPGNSGGALVNIKGELVGMNSANKLAQSAEGTSGDLGSIGIGWAIPIDVIEPVVEQLKEGQSPVHAWLGINPGDAKEKGLARGAEVTGFLDGGNAADAGVEEGDVITGIDDFPISNGLGLITTSLHFTPGDKVTLHVVRDGEEQEIEVDMAEKGALFED